MTSVKKPGKQDMSAASNRAMAAMRRAAIKARCQALEDEGGVFISQDGEMVWETDPKRIFPPGVEVKICECGRVLVVKDEPEDITGQAGE
jgi:hypothetical protein